MQASDIVPETGEVTMTRIILDAATSGKLAEAAQPVELCAPSGQVLGHFIPRGAGPFSPGHELRDPSGRILGNFVPPEAAPTSRRATSPDSLEGALARILPPGWELVSPFPSDEELDRIERANEKRYTTAEVLAYLEKL